MKKRKQKESEVSKSNIGEKESRLGRHGGWKKETVDAYLRIVAESLVKKEKEDD